MRKIWQGGALLLSAVLLAGCGSSSYSGAADSAGSHETVGDFGYDSTASREEAGLDMDAATDAAQIERQIIITGELYATATDPFAAADAVLNLVTDAGGFVEGRTQRGKLEDGDARVQFTARIPADKADATIAAIEDSAEVYEVATKKEDVTDQVLDVDARIKALQTSVDRLTTLLEEAQSTEAVFDAEDALTRRQAELDSLRAIQRDLSNQVAYATLNIHINSEEVYTSPPDGFMGGLTAGWDGLVSTFLAVVTAVGAIIPWLIVIVPLGFLIAWAVRRVRRNRGQRMPAAKVESDFEHEAVEHEEA